MIAAFPCPPADEAFWQKVKLAAGDCWEWSGSKTIQGYGRVRRKVGDVNRTYLTHRVAYQWLIGSLALDVTLDHLCRNRACVNPDHLEPVTQSVNSQRGFAPTQRAGRAGTCIRGHDRSDVYVWGGVVVCRPCERARKTARSARKASARTHCKNGHPLAEYGRKRPDNSVICGRCISEWTRSRYV